MAAPQGLDYSLLIATKDRPEELRRALKCVLRQQPLPVQIIIVDDGALDSTVLEAQLGAEVSRLVYYRKNKPGVVASYNIGADLCEATWLLSIDDDIELDGRFVERLSRVVSAWRGPAPLAAVVGTAWQEVNLRPSARSRWRDGVGSLFFLSGGVEGRLLPSGLVTDFFHGHRRSTPWRIETISAGLSLVRTDLLQRFRYDPWFEGYAYGQDKELGFRLSRDHAILYHPEARAHHRKSVRARTPSRRLGSMRVENQFYTFRKHFGGARWVPFLWAQLGQLVIMALGLATGRGRAARFQELCGAVVSLVRGGRRPCTS
jgi:glycosyltransferase involved in cell wall biosynthesis